MPTRESDGSRENGPMAAFKKAIARQFTEGRLLDNLQNKQLPYTRRELELIRQLLEGLDKELKPRLKTVDKIRKFDEYMLECATEVDHRIRELKKEIEIKSKLIAQILSGEILERRREIEKDLILRQKVAAMVTELEKEDQQAIIASNSAYALNLKNARGMLNFLEKLNRGKGDDKK